MKVYVDGETYEPANAEINWDYYKLTNASFFIDGYTDFSVRVWARTNDSLLSPDPAVLSNRSDVLGQCQQVSGSAYCIIIDMKLEIIDRLCLGCRISTCLSTE